MSILDNKQEAYKQCFAQGKHFDRERNKLQRKRFFNFTTEKCSDQLEFNSRETQSNELTHFFN